MSPSALARLSLSLVSAAACAALAVPAAGQPAVMARAASQEVRPVQFSPSIAAQRGVLVLPLASMDELPARAATLSAPEQAAIARALETSEFSFAERQRLSLRGIGEWHQILVVGLGDHPSQAEYQRVGAVTGRALLDEAEAVTVAAGGMTGEAVAAFATGMGLGDYRSDLYTAREEQGRERGGVTIVSDAASAARASFENRGTAMIAAMNWTRDISNEPGNAVYPESFVERARSALSGLDGVSIEVLDENRMGELGMGAILGVGRGSERPPRMMIVRYNGAGTTSERPVVLVGKGITFDTGGISIKSRDNMENMRMDMSGAASVVGTVLALARSRAPVNVVAVAALAENMPGGRAIRPGDVLQAMNGRTIQVISTDAEGRLVLADAFSWVERNLDPAAVVDVATLTGSVRGALSDDYAGLFSRHDALAGQLAGAGEIVGEPLWRLPIHESYADDMRSTIADLRNTSSGSGGGAGTAAFFLGEFLSRDLPWAHLDIANMAWSGANDWKPDGSTGFAVRLLDRFVRDFRHVERSE